MDVALLICRLVLVVVFLWAALAKALDREAFARTLSQFGVAARAIPVVAVFVPFAELAVAVALVPMATVAVAAIAAVTLLGVFTAAVGSVMAQGAEAECHCFGSVTAQPVGPRTLARNAGLLAVGAVSVAGGTGASATGWAGGLSTTEAVLVAACALLAIGLAGNAAKEGAVSQHWFDRMAMSAAEGRDFSRRSAFKGAAAGVFAASALSSPRVARAAAHLEV